MTRPFFSLLLVAGEDEDEDVTVSVGTVFRPTEECRWELVVAGQDKPPSFGALEGVAPAGRLRWVPEAGSGGAADQPGTLQAALAASTGEYVAVVGPGDIVEPGVLPAAFDYLTTRPFVDVLFTDEQWPGEGAEGIFTKPAWNAEYLLGMPYLGRLCFIRRDLLLAAGGFAESTERVEEWDAQLRVTEVGAVVEHIPAVGVTHPRATVVDAETEAARLGTVERHFRRSGVEAVVERADRAGWVRAWRHVPVQPLVSVIMPTIGGRRAVRGEDLLLVANSVRALCEVNTYQHWELVLVTSDGMPPAAVDEVAALAGDRLTVAPVAGPFNFSRSVNEGARRARGQHLLLLNDDTEVLEPRSIERMVGVAQDPGIGAVGAKLLFQDGTIQHLGIAHNDAWEPSHPFMFTADGPAHFGMGSLDLDYPAVTGACLLTPRDLFVELGGLTTRLPLNYNDVDYCFKVRHSGRRVVSTPAARWLHFESASRTAGLEPFETAFLREYWAGQTFSDPFANLREVR